MRPLALTLSLAVTGCAVQETPLGYQDAGPPPDAGRPVVMLLIDKSGSMNFAADDQDPACPSGCGSGVACPANCRTRMRALKAAFATVQTTAVPQAWMGLALFPTTVAGGSACSPTSSADIKAHLVPKSDSAAGMAASFDEVNTQIQALVAGGGTPTGASVKFLSTYQNLTDTDRARHVILITDGAPNCNDANVNDCNDAAACKCTLNPVTSCSPTSFCRQGCLDADASAAEVEKLRTARGVQTTVIGLGADTTGGDARAALDALAAAGGRERKCPLGTNAECGPSDTCDTATQRCSRKYYKVTSADELAAALRQILDGL